jgi:hypothetical protein
MTSLYNSVIANDVPERLPKDSSTVIRNIDVQLNQGICFGKRSNFFCVHVFPAGHIFTVEGQSIPIKGKQKSLEALALLNTPLVRFSLNKYCGQHKYSGYVNLFPYRPLSKIDECSAKIEKTLDAIRRAQCFDETQSFFTSVFPGSGLHERASIISELIDSVQKSRSETESFCHEQSITTYKVSEGERSEIESFQAEQPDPELPISDLDFKNGCKWFSAHSEISLALGIVFGRWDFRFLTDSSLLPRLPDFFEPLPLCPPNMLVGPDKLPAKHNYISSEEWLQSRTDVNNLPPKEKVSKSTITDNEYPVTINWNGILIDDPGFKSTQTHSDDIVLRVRQVIDSIWKDKALDIEQEACEILGVSKLREYFRKPEKFFQDHIKRYYKSRRKAPIYWQLATPSASYSVWLYYHRLDRDTFYKVLEYVKDKLKYEESNLESLRQEFGPNPNADKRKQIEDQEFFVQELRGFRDEVARITPLWNPNLNDGVIINSAPLWRLVAHYKSWQDQCKMVWDKLVNEDYDWAHLAMHLWPERVVPKCQKDRSLAIAHGLEDRFWYEDDKGKMQPREVSQEDVDALVKERTSAAVKSALQSLLDAPEMPTSGKKRKKKR